MELFLPIGFLKGLLPILAIVAGIFVITTKNAIISVFNLIVLYILVAFYLIYIGMTYLGISYIVIYIGAIAILFLFVIMMIDIEIVEKRNNNYLPLLFLLLGSFFLSLKNIFHELGIIKINSFFSNLLNKEKFFINNLDYEVKEQLFDLGSNLLNNSILDLNIKEEISKGLLKEQSNNKIDIGLIDSMNTNNSINNINYDIYNENISNPAIFNILNNNIVINDQLNNSYLFNLNINTIDNNYLLIIPNWDSTVNKVTQISTIGDVLYTVYHSYIYLVSVLLLLGMIGAIILTADTQQVKKRINIREVNNNVKPDFNKNINSSLFLLFYLLYIPIFSFKVLFSFLLNYYQANVRKIIIYFYLFDIISLCSLKIASTFWFLKKKIRTGNTLNNIKHISPFFAILENEQIHSEGIIGSLFYFIIFNLIIAFLLLFINSYFSLSVKYLDKGGGFECGFTSFVQTRERFNVIFYRVSLLFLVFDLEIILAFPYPAIYQKNQNISKNNVLAFLYILIIGFIYELKEGALNIVKKAHSNEIILDK